MGGGCGYRSGEGRWVGGWWELMGGRVISCSRRTAQGTTGEVSTCTVR